MGNKGYQGATIGDRVLQGATGCHSGLQRVTGDYKVLQITCFLRRILPLPMKKNPSMFIAILIPYMVGIKLL